MKKRKTGEKDWHQQLAREERQLGCKWRPCMLAMLGVNTRQENAAHVPRWGRKGEQREKEHAAATRRVE
jgi:hypothetical protein